MAAVKVSNVWKSYTRQFRIGVKELLVNRPTLADARFSRQWALQDITFSIESGRSFGIVGHNGTGKSTLLSVMLGTLETDRGGVVREGRICGMLELGSGFHPDLTGRENVFLNASILGLRIRETRKLFDSIVDFSELGAAIEHPMRTYSSGMSARLAFAVLVHAHSDLLLIDEVLAVGDLSFQKKCERFFLDYTKSGGTLVIVSHDLDAIMNLCSEGICLHEGRLLEFGPIGSVVERYRRLGGG